MLPRPALRPSLWAKFLTVLALLGCAPAAWGGSISYTNTTVDQSGTGFGSILNLLSVQNNPSEYGSVLWNGTADVRTGNAKNSSQTLTVAALATAGITSADSAFALIFNINEPGSAPDLVLNDFTLRFQDAAGGTLFDVVYDAPSGGLPLTMVGNGTGSSGHLFLVTLTAAEKSAFFGNSSNRVGMLITPSNAITGTAGGQENFYLADVRSNTVDITAVPEPSALALAGAAAAGLAAWWGRRKARPQAG